MARRKSPKTLSDQITPPAKILPPGSPFRYKPLKFVKKRKFFEMDPDCKILVIRDAKRPFLEAQYVEKEVMRTPKAPATKTGRKLNFDPEPKFIPSLDSPVPSLHVDACEAPNIASRVEDILSANEEVVTDVDIQEAVVDSDCQPRTDEETAATALTEFLITPYQTSFDVILTAAASCHSQQAAVCLPERGATAEIEADTAATVLTTLMNSCNADDNELTVTQPQDQSTQQATPMSPAQIEYTPEAAEPAAKTTTATTTDNVVIVSSDYSISRESPTNEFHSPSVEVVSAPDTVLSIHTSASLGSTNSQLQAHQLITNGLTVCYSIDNDEYNAVPPNTPILWDEQSSINSVSAPRQMQHEQASKQRDVYVIPDSDSEDSDVEEVTTNGISNQQNARVTTNNNQQQASSPQEVVTPASRLFCNQSFVLPSQEIIEANVDALRTANDDAAHETIANESETQTQSQADDDEDHANHFTIVLNINQALFSKQSASFKKPKDSFNAVKRNTSRSGSKTRGKQVVNLVLSVDR